MTDQRNLSYSPHFSTIYIIMYHTLILRDAHKYTYDTQISPQYMHKYSQIYNVTYLLACHLHTPLYDFWSRQQLKRSILQKSYLIDANNKMNMECLAANYTKIQVECLWNVVFLCNSNVVNKVDILLWFNYTCRCK